MDDPYGEIRKLIAEWDAANTNGNQHRNEPLSLVKLATMDFDYEWLVDSFWPVATQLHIFAAPKTGKSLLMLWVAVSLALGRDPFTGGEHPRRKVAYIDNEMTIKDLYERLTDMDAPFEELEGWLLYYPYPNLAPMDTPTGGIETLEMLQDQQAEVLIIDTLSRVVKGEENSNDTYRGFYNHTGRLLKANAIAMARLDHTGHDATKSRGASAKADDVDLVYGLERRTDKDNRPGYRLSRTHARISTVEETIDLLLADYPLSVRSTTGHMWTDYAIKKAKELDEIGAPIDVSQREASRLLKEANFVVGKTTYLLEALKLRSNRAPFRGVGS